MSESLAAKIKRSGIFIGSNVAAAAFVLAFLIYPAASSFFHRTERIDQADEQIARLKALQQIASPVAGGEVVFPGTDEGSSSAALQSDLKSIAAAAGASFIAVRGLEPRRLSESSAISASLELNGSIYAIRDVVRRIEEHTPALVIKSAILRGHTTDQDSELNVDLTVEGLMLKGASNMIDRSNRIDGDGRRGG